MFVTSWTMNFVYFALLLCLLIECQAGQPITAGSGRESHGLTKYNMGKLRCHPLSWQDDSSQFKFAL